MNDAEHLSRFFNGLDEFDGLAWELRVTFPMPPDPSRLPEIAAYLEAHIGNLARTTRACVLGRTGPTTWVLGASTYRLKRSFVGLETLCGELFDGPVGTIDITPRTALLEPRPTSAKSNAHHGGTHEP
jgi:hypothetical protein